MILVFYCGILCYINPDVFSKAKKYSMLNF